MIDTKKRFKLILFFTRRKLLIALLVLVLMVVIALKMATVINVCVKEAGLGAIVNNS